MEKHWVFPEMDLWWSDGLEIEKLFDGKMVNL